MTNFDELLDDLLGEPLPSPISEQIIGLRNATDAQTTNWFAQRLGFVVVQYLAQIGWYDYFVSGATDRGVEKTIRKSGSGKETMGHWCGLLRAVANAKGKNGLLAIGYSRRVAPTTLPRISDFVQGWSYVRAEQAKEAGPERILAGVADHLAKQQPKKVSLEDLVSTLNEYRNFVAHAIEHNFPAHHQLLLAQINSWLVPALAEFLQYDGVRDLLCDHVWTCPTPSRDGCRRAGELWEAPAIAQAGRRLRITIRSDDYFEPDDYLVKRDGRSAATLLFKFTYSNRWPTDPKPAEKPSRSRDSASSLRALELYDAVVELARLDGLTAAERERLTSIRELMELSEADVAPIHARYRVDQDGQEERTTPPGSADGGVRDETPLDGPADEAPSSSNAQTEAVHVTMHALDALLDQALPGSSRRYLPDGTLEGVEVGRGGLSIRMGPTTGVSAWFWQAEGGLQAVVGFYGDNVDPDAAYHTSTALLSAAGPDLLAGWQFAPSKWKPAGYEAFRLLPNGLAAPEETARLLGRAMVRLVGLLQPEQTGTGPGLSQTALLVGREPATLQAEIEAFAHRALNEPWEDTIQDPGWAWEPSLRLSRKRTFVDGRVGVDLCKEWTPGVYVGVLVNPKDHCTGHSQPLLGVDVVVILSTHKSLQHFDRDAYVASLPFAQLRERLTSTSETWDFHDHLASKKPNLWHPIHLRRPLLEVWEGAHDAEERYRRTVAAWRDGVRLLLEGGELANLENERQQGIPFGSTSARHHGGATDWPEAGRMFLARLRPVLLESLHFEPSAWADDEDLEEVALNDDGLYFDTSTGHKISIWFTDRVGNRAGQYVKIGVGFYSRNPSRDRPYRNARANILHELGEEPMYGDWSLEECDYDEAMGLGGFRNIELSELASNDLAQDVTNAVIELSRLVAKHLEGVDTR